MVWPLAQQHSITQHELRSLILRVAHAEAFLAANSLASSSMAPKRTAKAKAKGAACGAASSAPASGSACSSASSVASSSGSLAQLAQLPQSGGSEAIEVTSDIENLIQQQKQMRNNRRKLAQELKNANHRSSASIKKLAC